VPGGRVSGCKARLRPPGDGNADADVKGLAPRFAGRSLFSLGRLLQLHETLKAMADRSNKVPENVAGRYYVDVTCIDCDLCRETAPSNFTRDEAGRRSFVFRQPDNTAQEAACEAAREECPVEAIGRDG
jgi:ferredoxin